MRPPHSRPSSGGSLTAADGGPVSGSGWLVCPCQRIVAPSRPPSIYYGHPIQVTLSGLEPGGSYQVKVRALFDARRSRWSNTATVEAAAVMTGGPRALPRAVGRSADRRRHFVLC